MVPQDRWSLETGSALLKCRSSCQEYPSLEDGWLLVAVVSQDRLHCITKSKVLYKNMHIYVLPIAILVLKTQFHEGYLAFWWWFQYYVVI